MHAKDDFPVAVCASDLQTDRISRSGEPSLSPAAASSFLQQSRATRSATTASKPQDTSPLSFPDSGESVQVRSKESVQKDVMHLTKASTASTSSILFLEVPRQATRTSSRAPRSCGRSTVVQRHQELCTKPWTHILNLKGFDTIGSEESVWVRAAGGKYSEDIYVSAHVDNCLLSCKSLTVMAELKAYNVGSLHWH
jgi:hypothetical protein